jgi:hemolysin activation/secretion protein
VQRSLLLAAVGAVVLSLPSAVLAQAIERNLPPAPKPTAPDIAAPNALPADQDDKPIGPALAGIVVLGGTDAPVASPGAGIDVSRTPRLANDKAALARFLGRPLSRKLIAEIEAQIAGHYRDAGFAFVNLTTPEQDVTAGVLQVRALEFHLGSKSAPGASDADAAYILSRVRVGSGDPIDTDQLAQDLDWLNRYPFRHSEAQFTPSAQTGATDLKLVTTTGQPWSAYVGYANSGSPLTGEDRYFTGLSTSLPWLHDAFASYQFTASGDAVFDNDQLFSIAPNPAYVSSAGRIVIPTSPREDIEATLNYVRTNQPVQAFVISSTILEATLAYRAALSDFSPGTPGEAVVGIEAKRDDSRTLFGGTAVAAAGIEVYQATFGYADQVNDGLGRTSLDVTLHVSPGGLDAANSDAAFTAFSKGRFGEARYVYVGGDLTRFTRLPPILGMQGFALVNSFIGQYAASPLPQTEQMGLGGTGLVRGYTLDDGAFDSAFVSRNELRAPAFTIFHRTGPFADLASPYLFFDDGYGHAALTGTNTHMAAAGLALDEQLGPHISATIDGAWAIQHAGLTNAGAIRLESRVTISF